MTVRLGAGAYKGDRADLDLKVEGMHQPLRLMGALAVLGPRPKIATVKASLPEERSVALKSGELPTGAVVSFSMQVENLASDPVVAAKLPTLGS